MSNNFQAYHKFRELIFKRAQQNEPKLKECFKDPQYTCISLKTIAHSALGDNNGWSKVGEHKFSQSLAEKPCDQVDSSLVRTDVLDQFFFMHEPTQGYKFLRETDEIAKFLDMYQMLKQFDDFMPQGRGELDSSFGPTDEYLQNISERLRSRVVIVTMFPHILLTIFLWLWRSSDIVSDRYLTYSIATSIIFIELRTPIHGILASTEILCSSSSLTSAQRALIYAIQNSGINVIHMADHILRVAKTEDLNVLKGITHETIPFDLYKATEQIAD
ncbi:8186_t:CDS:2, partial [Gigaspora rosea]